ncbi:hypothetical protein [Actinokineospora sp. NBRC 105648]|uniref:hypothetical protein n=1 Tax=Actinokineospora sp. NBRC 105648 TaxID=3032206 RepID=UPI0024A5DA00|nr:hypothetical protein [Actinokineospora sp. NBRC 105648]GLZ38044.1 hypothetical protein Acsp05_16680 [Actinokineospora sp. NBRC 105648]
MQRLSELPSGTHHARVPFEVPTGAELVPRLASALGVVYLLFNAGYSATAGPDLARSALCVGGVAAGPGTRRPRAGRARGARTARADGAAGILLRACTDAAGEIVTLLGTAPAGTSR